MAAGSTCYDGAAYSPARKGKWAYYAVGIGRHPGIYSNTRLFMEAQCGVPGALFKGFDNLEQALVWFQDITSTCIDYDKARTFLLNEAATTATMILHQQVTPALEGIALGGDAATTGDTRR